MIISKTVQRFYCYKKATKDYKKAVKKADNLLEKYTKNIEDDESK